jgi:TRAP transporter TAXI family solute receptor
MSLTASREGFSMFVGPKTRSWEENMRTHLAAVALTALAAFACTHLPAHAETVILGASKPGHSAYNIVVAYSQAIRKGAPEIDPTVQASGGSIDAVQFMQTKRVEAAPVGASAPYEAFNGKGQWEGKPFKEMRTWLPMYSWGAQLVVKEDSDIESWADLKGKRV